MQLRYDNTLRSIDDERTVVRHVRYRAKKHVLNKCAKVLMVRVGTIQLHLRLEGYAVSQPALQALVNSITRRVDVVIQELKNEIVSRVGDREILGEYLIQTVILAFFGRCVQL